MDREIQKQVLEALKSADTYPTGPVSAWPEERDMEVRALLAKGLPSDASRAMSISRNVKTQPEIKVSGKKMVQGLVKTAGAAIKGGKVSSEIREERYDTCKQCPAFRQKDKRCSECGCFMEAKTWVNASPSFLCPLKKWSR